MRKVMLGALVCGMAAGAALGSDRVNVSQKGSLLVFPKIEIVFDGPGANANVLQDTFITLTNDYNLNPDANLKMYFVNGDVNTNGPSCNYVCDFADATAVLTPDQPAYWSVIEGRAISNSGLSFTVVGDPIADPSGNGNYVLRGYLIVFAVYSGDDVTRVGQLVRWNHLFGEATIVNYQDSTAYTYHAYAYRGLLGTLTNDVINATETINLDGIDYENTFDKLIFNFFVDGSEAFSNVDTHSHEYDGDLAAAADLVTVTSDLTLMIVDQDFVGTNGGRIVPATTLVRAVIWNENENKKTNTTRCITCWDNTQLSSFAMGTNWFTMDLGTDMGKAELMGEQNLACEVDVCPDDGKMLCVDPDDICIEYMNPDDFTPTAQPASVDEFALLGVITKNLDFATTMARAATTLNGKGDADATMLVDTHGGGGATDESPTTTGPVDETTAPIQRTGTFSQLQRR